MVDLLYDGLDDGRSESSALMISATRPDGTRDLIEGLTSGGGGGGSSTAS